MLTEHFSAEEIGAPPELLPFSVLLAAGLEEVRAVLGPDTAIIVIRGYSSPEHNAAVGGVEGSYHTIALAADVKFRRRSTPLARWQALPLGDAMAELVQHADRMPLVRRLIEDRRLRRPHVHVEVRHPLWNTGAPLQYEIETEGGFAPWSPP